MRKEKVRKHKLIMSQGIPNPEVFNFVGMYGYNGGTLAKVQLANSTAGLRGMPVAADLLYIDVDSLREEVLEQVRIALKDYQYFEYFSGSKGSHFQLPHQMIDSANLVNSHKEFVQSLGLGHLVDMSIYRESGIIRVEGSVHEKTGIKKHLLHINNGKKLKLPIVVMPPWEIPEMETSVEEELKYRQNLLRDVGVGGRHRHFYILFQNGRRAGRTSSEIMNDIQWYNRRLKDPKSEEDVENEVRGFGK